LIVKLYIDNIFIERLGFRVTKSKTYSKYRSLQAENK
jgi:hypothetical protein